MPATGEGPGWTGDQCEMGTFSHAPHTNTHPHHHRHTYTQLHTHQPTPPTTHTAVYGGKADGSELTAGCGGRQGCGALPPKGWVCFFLDTDAGTDGAAWNYLTLELNRTSSSGDPDICAPKP